MAAKKSAQYPYKWPDGSWHSKPYAAHMDALAAKDAKRVVGTPSPGTYDTGLDAQLRAADRQYGDLSEEDIPKARERALSDYGTGIGELELSRARNTEDYNTAVGDTETGYQRNLSDLLRAREQGSQDYNTNVETLGRNYQRLGTAQGEAQRKAGAFAGSGAALQAAAKRAENQAIDRKPIDTAYNRFMEESNLSQGRLGEDRQRSLDALLRSYTRSGQDTDIAGQKLSRDYLRGDEDLTSTLTRAGTANEAFRQDIYNAMNQQYQQYTGGQKLPNLTSGQSTITGPTAPKKPTASPQPTTLTAGPGVPGTKKRRKGRTVTYTASVGGP